MVWWNAVSNTATWNKPENLLGGPNARHVGRVVEGCERRQGFDVAEDLVGDDRGSVKDVTTVHDTVTDEGDVGGVPERLKDGTQTLGVVDRVASRFPDSLNETRRNRFFGLQVNHLKLD